MANNALTPMEGESLDLPSRAFRDKKTGRYTRGVNIKSILDSINILEPTTKSLNEAAVQLEEQVKIFAVGLGKLFAPKPAAPVQEKRPSMSLAREGAEKLASSSFSLAKLALLIPLLFNETTKKIIAGFFEGVLKGIGLSEESIKMMKVIAAGLVTAFKVFLGYKVVRSVLDVFDAFKKLADATGILGILVDKQGKEVALRESNINDRTVELENENKGLKNKGRKNRRLIDRLKTKTKVFIRNIKKFLNFKKIVLGGLKAVRTAVRVIKTAAAWTGLGFILGAAIDAGFGTLIDFYTKEEESEDTKDSAFQAIGKSYADNFVKSLTFGAINLNDLKKMINGLLDAGVQKGLVPEWAAKRLKFNVKEEQKPPVTATQPQRGSAAAAAPPPSSTPVSTAAAQTGAPAMSATAATSAAAPQSPAAAPVPSSEIPSKSIQDVSESNISTKKELSSSMVNNVVNVNNSQNLYMKTEDKPNYASDVMFNSAVGA